MEKNTHLDLTRSSTEDENMNHLTNILTAFSHVADVPITFFNQEWRITWDCLTPKRICSLFESHEHCKKTCMKTLQMALDTALHLGEPYVFLCDAGLIKIAYPFTVNGKPKGGFFAGPIAMGTNWDNTIKKIAKKMPYSEAYTPQLITFLGNLKTHTPTEVSYIYDVFCNSVFSARILENDYGRIHEEPQKEPERKKMQPVQEPAYPDNLQEQLIHAIQSGNEEAALNNLRLFYEKTYILDSGNLSLVKVHLTELFSILSRAISSGNTASAYYLEDLEALHNAFTFSETFDLSNNLILKLTRIGSFSKYDGTSLIVRKTIDHVNEFYSQELTLADTAAAIHTNVSYLSALFKKEMGITFSQYLTQVRLNHSVKLLAETHLSMTEIALASGFSGQSYFTKLFKEFVGMTPGQYRKNQHKFNQIV